MAQASDVGGVRAVELEYRPIRDISSGRTAFYQTRTLLNSPKLGVMMPEVFREVAEMSSQCLSLFVLEYIQLLEAVKKFTEREIVFSWLSVYMPVRFLGHENAEKKLIEYSDLYEVPANRVCFELPVSLLTDSPDSAPAVLRNIRNRGYHFMLSGFGGSSAMMRIAEFDVDHVLFSPSVIADLGRDERSDTAVKSMTGFFSALDCTAVPDGVSTSRQAEKLYELECTYCAGPLAGSYTKERYVRRSSNSSNIKN